MSPPEHDAALWIQYLSRLDAAKLHERTKMNLPSIGFFSSMIQALGRTAFKSLEFSLLVSSVHPARPPKQLEQSRPWVLQLRCGQNRTNQQNWALLSNIQRCCLWKLARSGLPAFDNSLSSYLQVSFFHSARPPKQVEFTEIWVLEPEHGQGWTIQQVIPFSNFGVVWEESIFGFRLPLIFQIGCKDGLHRWHGWCNRHRELDVQV